jgi:hypothetical protein
MRRACVYFLALPADKAGDGVPDGTITHQELLNGLEKVGRCSLTLGWPEVVAVLTPY